MRSCRPRRNTNARSATAKASTPASHDLRVRPWEYLLLGAKPQTWRSEDSALVIAAMYLDLNGDGRNERELSIAQMRSVLPDAAGGFPARARSGLGSATAGPAVAFAGDSRRRTCSTCAISRRSAFHRRSRRPAVTAALAPALDAPRPGSNNFAVAGALTGNGAAMLANDMHLGLRVPNIWFRARLRYPDASAPNGQR